MRKPKPIAFLILTLAVICLSGRSSPAQDAGEASSTLCEYGIKLYKEGQIDDAIHELKKALMVNPHNVKAKNFLRKIYSERSIPFESLMDAAKKIKISEYENQIKKLREDARNYQRQLSNLNAQNQAKEADLERLNRQFDFQKDLFARKEQDIVSAHKGRQTKIAELENRLKQLQKETNDYQKESVALNNQYLSKQAELEKLTRELQGYKGRGEKAASLENQLNRLQKEASDYQKQLAALNSRYSTKETQAERLKNELYSQKELLDKKEQELDLIRREQKKQLADLADKRKELAKLRADYEKRLKKLEMDLKAKQAEESILIEECQFIWAQGPLDEFKTELAELECGFEEESGSAGRLKLAEKQKGSSWEKLNRDLELLLPDVELTFYEEKLFSSDKQSEFKELEMLEPSDMDIETIFSESDNQKPGI